MNKIYSVILLTVLVAAPPLSAFAETVVRTGKSVSIEADQVIDDDFYVLAEKVSVSGEVRGDMYSLGGTVTINGSIWEDLTIVGGSAQVHASVTDDVRIIAPEVLIAEHIGGDLFVIGGSLKVLSSAHIDGDIFFYGGEAEISGTVGGSIMGASNSLRIDSSISGDVNVIVAQTLVLGSRASIAGNLTYQSQNEATRAQNAAVEGEIIYTQPTMTGGTGAAREALIPMFIVLFATLCLYLFFKVEIQILTQKTLTGFSRSGLIGLGTIMIAPVIIILLFVTVLGALVGALGFLLWAMLGVGAVVLMNVICAGILAKIFTKSYKINLLWILSGAVTVVGISSIPFVGAFALFVLFTVTLGGLVYALYEMIT